MLSLCMIVKNEEENLKNCLSKVTDFVDEIIIVDTGSTDHTKAIAEGFSDKIYDFKWCNDFSKARNFSISKSSNDWILVLDADEFVFKYNRTSVDEFIKDPSNVNKVGRIQRLDVIEDNSGLKKYIDWGNRLFNRNYFHYEGIIHEQLVSLDGKPYETQELAISENHVGYTIEAINKTNKLKRNIDLLEEAIKNDPEDPYLFFQLGKSYFVLKDYKTSSRYFENALSFQLDFKLEYVEDLIETYGYCLINSERYSDCLALENFIDFYSQSADFHFVMGLIYMNNAKFVEAITSFLECTKFQYSKVEGITTYCSYYNIGVIYEVLGHREKAIDYYTLCGNFEPALNRLAQF